MSPYPSKKYVKFEGRLAAPKENMSSKLCHLSPEQNIEEFRSEKFRCGESQ